MRCAQVTATTSRRQAAELDTPWPAAGYEHRIEQAENEIANLRAAFGWSIETGDIKRALELASSLQLLWLTRGHRRRKGWRGWMPRCSRAD